MGKVIDIFNCICTLTYEMKNCKGGNLVLKFRQI